jgi:hypothetical protein
MLLFKKIVIALVMGVFLCSGLFAWDVMDTYFNGDLLNSRINKYVINVSNLIPDATTQLNVWSYAPGAFGGGGWFGAGINANATFYDRTQVGSVMRGVEAFGADNIDLAQFPEAIPFLPAVSFDLRFGSRNGDLGITGMWLDENILAEYVGTTFFGEGSSFALRLLGFDYRYALVKEKKGAPYPSVTLQAGYYYTAMHFSISATEDGKTESVMVDFRNDSFLFGVQIAKEKLVPLFTPYAGFKVIFSKTDSEYEWMTSRPVIINDEPFLGGAHYFSRGRVGDYKTYSQLYAGVGFHFLFNHLATIGAAYTLGTDHFSINAAVRILFGG